MKGLQRRARGAEERWRACRGEGRPGATDEDRMYLMLALQDIAAPVLYGERRRGVRLFVGGITDLSSALYVAKHLKALGVDLEEVDRIELDS